MTDKSVVVVYSSKYGWTAEYASWLAESLSCEFFNIVGVDEGDLYQYEVIIYGAGVYRDHVNGAQNIFAHQNRDLFNSRKIILFTVGMNYPQDEQVVVSLRQNIPRDIYHELKIYHFRGGIDYNRLNFGDRVTMLFVYLFNKVRLQLSATDTSNNSRVLVEKYGQRVDFTNRTSLQPLIDYVETL